ncbi:MAG: hypothetical protein ACE5I5_08770 [Candidatus Heimdallarchaeota archaeon]
MAKIVQTDLNDEEYQMFVDFLEKKKLTIKEGLREAIRLFLRQELDFKNDPFFKSLMEAQSGRTDVSEQHDRYLYAGNDPEN